jgi:hypothetical protein
MAIKSKFAFSNNCYKELLNLISDVLLENHKMPKDMYQSKKLLFGLDMAYEKINVCDNNFMLFWKETASEKKCIVCGERRFVEVENDDGLTVTTKIARKQLHYMPLIPRLKHLFISKNTAKHMRWHKEGVRENPNVMAHPADIDAWKALDAFDSSFADEVRNVRFSLTTDGFSPFNLTATSYSCWPVFAVPYNLPPALCIWISKLSSYACDSTESMIYYTKCMVHSCRLGIFDSTIDSSELKRRGRQSTYSSSQSSRSRSSAQEIELAVLRQQAEYHQSVLREQLEYQRQQVEYQRQQAEYQKKDEYYANF